MYRGITGIICLWLGVAAGQPIQAAPAPSESQLIVYLECPPNLQDRVSLRLDSLVLSGPDDSAAFDMGGKTVSSDQLSGHQTVLLESPFAPGRYTTARFVFGDVSSYSGVALLHPRLPEGGVTVPILLQAGADEASVIFLLWTPGQGAYEGDLYVPQISLLKAPSLPPGSLAFVSNEDSNNITVIDRSTYRVVDVIAVADGPADIIYSNLSQQLYVACMKADIITVIDVPSQQIIKKLQLSFGDAPGRLAVSADNRYLYILNTGSNTVSVVDIAAFQEIARLNIGNGPIGLAVDSFTGLLYVSSRFSSNIEVFDPSNFSQVSSLNVETSAGEIVVNSADKVLYVSHATQRTFSAVDLSSGRMLSTVTLCGTASGLVFNRYVRVLYAALDDCKEIAFMIPDQGLETGYIALNSIPGRIGLDGQNKQLMVCVPSDDRVDFYSTNSRKLLASINVGKNPSMIVLP